MHPPPLAIGAPAPDFSLPGIDGKTYSLASFKEHKVLVVIFTAVHCPTAEVYEGAHQAAGRGLHAEGRRVRRHPAEQREGAAARRDGLHRPRRLARGHEGARRAPRSSTSRSSTTARRRRSRAKYGPIATPHVFVFDSSGCCATRAASTATRARRYAKVPDARNAIDAVLAGTPVPVEKTPTVGCSIKWLEKEALHDAEMTKIDAGARPAREGRRRRHQGAAAERHRQDAARELLGDVVRAVHGGVPRAAEDLPDVPQAAVRPGHGQHQLSRRGERRPASSSRASTPSSRNLLSGTMDPYELMKAFDPEWDGGVPYSMVIAPGGKVLYKEQRHARHPQDAARHPRQPPRRRLRRAERLLEQPVNGVVLYCPGLLGA